MERTRKTKINPLWRCSIFKLDYHSIGLKFFTALAFDSTGGGLKTTCRNQLLVCFDTHIYSMTNIKCSTLNGEQNRPANITQLDSNCHAYSYICLKCRLIVSKIHRHRALLGWFAPQNHARGAGLVLAPFKER